MATSSNNILPSVADDVVDTVDGNLENRTPERIHHQLALGSEKSSSTSPFNLGNEDSQSNVLDAALMKQVLHFLTGRVSADLHSDDSERQSKANKLLKDLVSLYIAPSNDKGVAQSELADADLRSSLAPSGSSSYTVADETESRDDNSITSTEISANEAETHVSESIWLPPSDHTCAPPGQTGVQPAQIANDRLNLENGEPAVHGRHTQAYTEGIAENLGSDADTNHESRIIDTSPPSGPLFPVTPHSLSVPVSTPDSPLTSDSPLTPNRRITPHSPEAPDFPLAPGSAPEIVPTPAPNFRQSDAPPDADEAPPRSRRWRFGGQKRSMIDKSVAVVTASDLPAVILPSPPNDAEKFCYGQTRRVPLYAFGTFSFLSVSVGMWFFVVSSVDFSWFGIFVGLIQIYLIISYTVGYCGRDFDVGAHKKLIEENPLTVEPSVNVYLPCCKEPLEVLENTYKYVSRIGYRNVKVHVLDDGGLNTVKRLAEQYNFNYITRDDKPRLKKAGNLRWAFARTSGEFFAIFDADFCPRPDFLKTILPYMQKEKDIAIVQSPQFFRPSSEQTWVEQGASATQELFYRIVQVNRDRWGAAICVGSNAVYRRASLVDVGGTAEIGHSEDVHTGFYALARGWRLKYIPLALACGVSPDTPKAFFSQQMRWCSGSTTLLTNPEFWKSKLSFIQKMCYLSGMMYYTAASMMIFLNPIPGLLMICIDPKRVMFYNCAYALPSLIYSVVVFRLWSRQRYNFNVNFVFVIQQFAYLMAIKDRILGTTASWVPSGDNSSHGRSKEKAGGNNKYRNMRILCCIWMFGTASGMITAATLRIIEGYTWYHFLPQLLLEAFNLFITHKFMFYSH